MNRNKAKFTMPISLSRLYISTPNTSRLNLFHISKGYSNKFKKYFLCKSSGFTLIEMLVVIAIISILASMLAPSLISSMNSARSVLCINNLKQINVLIMNYTDENNGFYSRVRGSGNASVFEKMMCTLDNNNKPVLNESYCSSSNIKVFECPSDKIERNENLQKISYEMNINLLAPVVNAWYIPSKMRNSYPRVNKIMKADCSPVNFHIATDFWRPAGYYKPHQQWGENGATRPVSYNGITNDYQVHGDGGNMLFGDGHAGFMSNSECFYAQTLLSSSYPERSWYYNLWNKF